MTRPKTPTAVKKPAAPKAKPAPKAVAPKPDPTSRAQKDAALSAELEGNEALSGFRAEPQHRPMPENDHTMHQGMHDSHESEQHFDDEVHTDEWPENWAPPSALEAPEPRDGMVQRWVRLSMRGKADAENVKAQNQQGWKPRTLESVPEGSRANYPTMKDSRSAGTFIVNKDLVLCEMPRRLFNQMTAYYAQKRKSQVQALVDQPLAGAAIPGAEDHGFGAPHVVERKSRVTTREPIVAADR